MDQNSQVYIPKIYETGGEKEHKIVLSHKGTTKTSGKIQNKEILLTSQISRHDQ